MNIHIHKQKTIIIHIGDWGLGIGPNPQSPIPNPQSPIPNPQSPIKALLLILVNYSDWLSRIKVNNI